MPNGLVPAAYITPGSKVLTVKLTIAGEPTLPNMSVPVTLYMCEPAGRGPSVEPLLHGAALPPSSRQLYVAPPSSFQVTFTDALVVEPLVGVPMATGGPSASTVHDRLASGPVLPKESVPVTWKVWVPPVSPMSAAGDVQLPGVPVSR